MRRVIVISASPLFREGIRGLLAGVAALDLLGAVASLDEAQALALDGPPDTVIIDQEEGQAAEQERLINLLNADTAQVVAITLHDPGMTVYSRQRLSQASAQELLDVLQNV
jgi:DNA-binding NarL/FixJ family response regulator